MRYFLKEGGMYKDTLGHGRGDMLNDFKQLLEWPVWRSQVGEVGLGEVAIERNPTSS